MNTSHPQSFPLPMSRKALLVFFLVVTAVSAVTAWCFASGFTWSAICLMAVAAPLGLLFWYMLHVNPSRAVIVAGEEGLAVNVPPFVNIVVPYAEITDMRRVDLKTDSPLSPGKPDRGMSWGAYRAGAFALKDGGEATVAAASQRALMLSAGSSVLLLGPPDLDGLEAALKGRLS